MMTKPLLSDRDVEALISEAREAAEENGWGVSIAVVDDGGHPTGLLRLNGASAMSARMAMEKARTAAIGRRETKQFEEMINNGRFAFLSAPDLHGMLEGGIPVIYDSAVVGAVGVSGVKPAQDAQIASAAIARWLAKHASR